MEKVFLGTIGVDSGQMMLCDPAYKDSFTYEEACTATNISPGRIIRNEIGATLAAIVRSGYGDGVYDVFAYVGNYGEWGKRVAKLEIIFIDDKEEEILPEIGRALLWDELADLYDKTPHTGRPARTLPMLTIFAWAKSQSDRFYVCPKEETIHLIIKEK